MSCLGGVYTESVSINHPAKGPAPPESIHSSVPVGVHATKKKKNEKQGEKEGDEQRSTLQCANARSDLTGMFTTLFFGWRTEMRTGSRNLTQLKIFRLLILKLTILYARFSGPTSTL